MIIDKQKKILTNILWLGIKLFGWVPSTKPSKIHFVVFFLKSRQAQIGSKYNFFEPNENYF